MNDEVVYQVDAKHYRVTLFGNRFRTELVNGWGAVTNTYEYYLSHIAALERRKPKEVRVRFGRGWNYVDIAFQNADDAELFAHFLNTLI